MITLSTANKSGVTLKSKKPESRTSVFKPLPSAGGRAKIMARVLAGMELPLC